jgi:hypothetical protein
VELMSTCSKPGPDGTRRVTVAQVEDGLRVSASDGDGPLAVVRLITDQPDRHARAAARDLTAGGYTGDAA